MKGKTFSLATLSVLVLGCGHKLMQPPVTPLEPDKGANAAVPAQAEAEIRLGDLFTTKIAAYDFAYAVRTDQPIPRREPGDYVVYRITGNHLPTPVMVTQRVAERRGDRLIVDQSIDDGHDPIDLRLRIDDSPYGANRIVSVALVYRGVQLPYGKDAYRDLVNLLMPPVDHNEGLVDGARSSLKIGDQVIDCESTEYRVRMDGRLAFMTVQQSLSFPWGDLGGVIRDASGKVIYQAEILQLGGMVSSPAGMVAAHDDEGVYED